MSVRRHTRTGSHPQRVTKPMTQEMIGSAAPRRAERINPKWRVHYKRLLELRDQLVNQQRDQFADAVTEQPGFSMHMADAGTDSYDRDLALSMLSHEQGALYEVEEALNRIRNGTYGICEATGKKIPAARLQAVPWTRFTSEAERALEKKGAAERAQLHARETVRRGEPAPEPEEES
jgi:RNA polymerase-binding transcription factor DksA